MKKSTISVIALALCLLFAVLCLAACGDGGSQKGLVGSWEYQSGGYTYTFHEDGTGAYDVYGTGMNFTYADNGASIEISYEGTTIPTIFAYTIEGNTLILKDSFGSDVRFTRK